MMIRRRRALSLPPALLGAFLGGLLGSGCGGCEGSPETEEGFVRDPQGSVANAEALTMRPVTAEGYEVVEASPAARRRQAAAEAAREREQENLVREPTEPDPLGRPITLEEAVEGLPTDGQLVAEINTDLGTIFCDLYADKTPQTVANFIGLARGKRPWWDARAAQWRRAPAYEETLFHRVVPDYMIQGGDYLRDGTGTVGYTIPHEPSDLVHDRAGLLCMASSGPNENGAQFFITDGPAPQLDAGDEHTVFGRCEQTNIVERIARVPQDGETHRPTTDLIIERIVIRRIAGGATVARRSPPRMPEGLDPDTLGREASPGPSEMGIVGRPNPSDTFDPRRWTGGMRESVMSPTE